MGYTTDFTGKFMLNKKLDKETHYLLTGLATTRRMARNVDGYGVQGEFYTLDRDDYGQGRNANIIDYNRPPSTQPGLWCHWVPNKSGTSIAWDGGEKFYEYVEWLEYLIIKVLAPRGYELTGEVEWTGEDNSDMGKIVVTANIVSVKHARISYE